MLEFNNKDINLLILLSEIATIEQLARNKLDKALPKDLNISSFSVLNHFSGSKAEKTPLQLWGPQDSHSSAPLQTQILQFFAEFRNFF